MISLPIYSLHPLILYLTILLTFLLIYKVECDIFTLNNKYSQFQTLKTIHFGEFEDSFYSDHDGLLKRFKRDSKGQDHKAKASAPSITDSEIILDRSILNGTEYTGRAFVHWIGKETSEKVLVLTCSIDVIGGLLKVTESHLWSSDDYGSSFQEKDLGKDAQLSYFYTFPKNSKKLLFTDVGSNKIYTTSDELKTFQSSDAPVNPDVILPHPFIEDVLLLYSIAHRKLFSSMDFAQTWSLISENVLPTFYWASKDYDTNPHMVHMEIEGSVPNQALYKACVVPKCEDISLGGEPLGPFLPKSLIVHKEFMFAQKSNANGSESYLMVSYQRQPFQRAYFPENIKTNDFIILNLDDGQVFMAVNHGDKVNLYLSDETGHFFVLSLTDVSHQIIRPFYFGIDLHEVQGMKWTFLANAKNSQHLVKTYISFDKGGNWATLQPTDDLKKDCPSKQNCDLKLLIRDSPLGHTVLSNENAPGIILAHGSIGTNLTTTDTSIFSSRDGGWTWKKAPFTGIHRFNILDQGSVLSAIPDGIFPPSKAAKNMHYSCDEGDTWKTENFDTKGLIVKGVLTEPKILTLTEMLFGHRGRYQPWTLVKLNFSGILVRQCEKDDYEVWHPQDYNSKTPSNCILGRQPIYTRQKHTASCYNGKLIPKIKPKEICECTAEDYECDFGYRKEATVCKKTEWYYEGFFPLDCDEGSTYYKTKGYRKIPADICLEKEAEKKKYGKEKSPCPSIHPHGLLITSHNTNIITLKEETFFLEQTAGSKSGTNYTWDFKDSTPLESFTDFANASHIIHIFTQAGHYNVSLTAENSKGKSTAYLLVQVQDQISSIFITAPWAGKVGQPVEISVAASSRNGKRQRQRGHTHYVWTFGDEIPPASPELSWKNTMSHTYKRAGMYDVMIEAVNSVSSLSQPVTIKIFENAIILVLTFKDLNFMSNPSFGSLVLERIRQQILDDLGLNLDRIEVTMVESFPVKAHLYIFPSDKPEDIKPEVIKENITHLVETGEFGINLLGKRDEPGKIYKVTSIKPLSSQDDNHGPNMTPVYLAVPVLLLAIVASVILIIYCRRKARNMRQYNLLNTQDDSDALLDDDDDEGPLDLDIDFGVRESSRDDNMLDLGGGNHLVMVTGDRSDAAENC